MIRWIAPVTVAVLLSGGAPARAQAPNVVTREWTTKATVDGIERGSRLLTLRGEGNQLMTVYVEPSVKTFDDLQRGDAVTVRYEESVIVQVKPNAALSEARDTTEDAKKAGQAHVIQQQKAVVTIESIDPQGQFVSYRTGDNVRGVRTVSDKRLLQGLHVGDRVEVTFTRERAVSIERRR